MKRAILFGATTLALIPLMGCGSGSSPDPVQNGGGGGGRKLVYTATIAGSTDIYAMNPDGSGQVRVTTDGVEKSHLALSPDGSKVAYLVRHCRDPPT
ncbi:hypothetical protein [Armatimonas sp.]|uniref:TolB family protein n=1 Tax=Armatimonas sp. TaxID=1872638 RepID=UPI00286A7070|nr:hypothetical protein [Armatimonas sp.]